jgi:hypothetical protein
VPLLLFADDVALLSYLPQGLQRLLHCLADFCDENHLTVSICKTKVVVFHKALSQVRQEQQFTVQRKAVAVEDEYKYHWADVWYWPCVAVNKTGENSGTQGRGRVGCDVSGMWPVLCTYTVQPISEDEIVQSCSPAQYFVCM